MRSGGRTTAALALAFAIAGCQGRDGGVAAPPRATDRAPMPKVSSILSVPIETDTRALRAAIDGALPTTLWTINQREPRCIAPQKLKIFGAKLDVTPPIGCTIVGTVTRGAISLRGQGREIIADVPIHARISARDVGGVLKGETATGSAMAHARIMLDVAPDWTPRGTMRLSYDWTRAPGIDFLGQRIQFTDKADEKLAPVIRDLERDLPRELARLDLRAKITPLWQQSFTTLELNAKNPPVWMRVAPQRVIYGGYTLRGDRLRLDLALESLTQTYVGPRPDDPAPMPLPALSKGRTDGAFHIFVPVFADYAQLEPVIQRALIKRSKRPFDLPGLGPVLARFETVTAYGTTGGRIAVGLTLSARSQTGRFDETRGRIWMTALPVNQPGSAQVRFEQLTVTGDTDRLGGDLLLKIGNSPGFAGMIAQSLTQNFGRDLGELRVKIARAIERKREGDFTIAARIERIETGRIAAYGDGLYLPVRATGTAGVVWRPGN
ncbi:MAG: DUF4403 family protein [Sphingobium sp.]